MSGRRRGLSPLTVTTSTRRPSKSSSKDEQAHVTVKCGGSLELDEHVNVAVWAGIIPAVIPAWLGVQQRARRHGNAGILGSPGNVESISYRI